MPATHTQDPDLATDGARLSCELPAEPRSVSRMRHAVVGFARTQGVPEATLGEIALAVTEAATNAVLHAFVDRNPGTLALAAEPQHDALLVRVLDDGRGMQPRADSPGLGMGLPTMGQLAERLDLREGPGGRGTEVRMVFSAPGLRGSSAAGLDEERLAVLSEVGRLAEQAGWPAQGLEQLADVLVPHAALACAIELLDPQDRSQRLVARGDATPPAGLAEAALREPAGHALDGWVAAPLRAGERVKGTVALLPADAYADAIPFVELLAERISGGVATTRLVAELDRTRRRLERILGSLAEAITVGDERGNVVYANDAAVELLGASSVQEVLDASPGELAGRFVITREDGRPVGLDDLPGHRIVAGRPAPPLLSRSVERATGRARWLLTTATILDDEGLLAVNVIQDVTEAREAEQRLRLLVEVGALMADAADFEATLERITGLLVPTLADWAAIDLLIDGGTRLQRVGLAHRDPERLRFGQELHERYPPDPQELLASREPQLYPEITDELLEQGARDEEHLRLIRGVGMRSVMVVPLVARGTTLGAMTLATAESQRSFTEDDLAYAQDLARRAAIAVELARPAA